jgi:hypothetical protein
MKEHSKYPGGDGKTVLKWILKEGWDGMGWMDLTLDRDRRQVVMNIVMNLQVP